jgi:hypothetical protein
MRQQRGRLSLANNGAHSKSAKQRTPEVALGGTLNENIPRKKRSLCIINPTGMLDALYNHRAIGLVVLPNEVLDCKVFTMRMSGENNPV